MPLSLPKETGDVVRPYRTLESVKQQQSRSARIGFCPIKVDEVSVRSRPTFPASMQRLTPAKELRDATVQAIGERRTQSGKRLVDELRRMLKVVRGNRQEVLAL